MIQLKPTQLWGTNVHVVSHWGALFCLMCLFCVGFESLYWGSRVRWLILTMDFLVYLGREAFREISWFLSECAQEQWCRFKQFLLELLIYTQWETLSWSRLFFVSLQDVPKKHVTIKYSKYGIWQQNAAQRLRRGIPAILRSRKFRPQAEKKRGQERANVHKRLITLPSKLPPLWHPTEDSVSHKWRQDSLHRAEIVGDHSFVSLASFLWWSSTSCLPSSQMFAFFQSLLLLFRSSAWSNEKEIIWKTTVWVTEIQVDAKNNKEEQRKHMQWKR